MFLELTADATTLAVAALLHRLEHDDVSTISVPKGIDASSLSAATGVALHDADSKRKHNPPWSVLMSDEAIVVVSQRGATVEIPVFEREVEVDADFHAAIEAAWDDELSENHVSQGALAPSTIR